ncbi:hypothetical protein SPLA5a_PHROGS00136 [Salmonella phage SPLA5a]|nr:hypothetical protein SPLA5a_PHROGS00136 [Salmonella phage SPLA5a]
MKLRDENELVTIGRTILCTIGMYILIMYPGMVYILMSEDGLSLSQIWEKYSFMEMIIPLVAACWLGTPLGMFFAFIIVAFEVDI